MTQSYSTSQNKSSNKIAKNSEKEILDNNLSQIPEDSGGYYRIIPSHVFDDHSLLDKEKLLYGLLMGLCKKYGFSWATNKFLAQELRVTPRQIPRYLKRMRDMKLIFIEVLHNFERKIWVAETYHMRDRVQKIYNDDKEFNQRFDRYDTDVMGGMTWMSCSSNRSSIRDIKEVVKKSHDKTKVSPKISPPSSATTSFSQKKMRAQKKQLPFTEDQKDLLRRIWSNQIADPVIRRIEKLMENPNAYTSTDPYDDAYKFCSETSRKKINRFAKKTDCENKREIEEKNLDELNYFIKIYKPSEEIFHCSSETKTVNVIYFGKKTMTVLDYTLENFREKLYKWYEPYKLKK